jgi:hypothetical protein
MPIATTRQTIFPRAAGGRHLLGVFLVAAAIVVGCAQTTLLNSERIEQTFGSYGIEILSANGSERVSNLYSTRNGERTTRTVARVRFVEPIDEAVQEEHSLITDGASIGATFESRGWQVGKRNLRVGSRLLTAADADISALMRIEVPREVALHEYLLVVSKGGREIGYATITESHHPDHLTPAELRRLYD